MKDGSRQQGQGITLATNSFSKQDCLFLAKILNDKYALKTSSPLSRSPERGAVLVSNQKFLTGVQKTV